MSDALQYAVRRKALGRHLGRILLLQASFSLVPMVFAWADGDSALATALLVGIVVAGVGGWLLSRLPRLLDVQKNEILVVTALSFFLGACLNAPAIMAAGVDPVAAFFEATSAITTTGLTTLEDVHLRSQSFLFLRAWIQWYGGLGIVAFAVAMSLNPALLAGRISAGGAAADDAIGGARPHYRRICIVYGSLTIVTIGVLIATGLSWFPALTLALTAVSTGGFSPVEGSLANVPPAAAACCLIASVAAALPLVYYHLFYRRRVASVLGEPQWKAMLLAIGLATLLISLVLRGDGRSWSTSVWEAATQTASAQSGAGFSTASVGQFPPAGRIVLIAAMFVGGAAGSTTGGTKLLRWLIVIKATQRTIRQALTPRDAVVHARLGSDSLIQEDELNEAASVIVAFVAVVGGIWLALAWGGYDPLDALFEATSAVCTTGLSAGICGPDLPSGYQLLLCFGMLAGRVEIIGWMVLCWPPTWLNRRRSAGGAPRRIARNEPARRVGNSND